MKKPKLGTGTRFKDLAQKIQKKEGYSASQAKGAAAAIGRAKFGAKKMGKLASAGRKRK